MEALVLAVHILSFSLSLILFPILAIAAIKRHYLPRKTTSASLVLTGIGLVTGIGLLIVHPAGSRCLMLATYLVSFVVLYRAVISIPAPTFAEEISRR